MAITVNWGSKIINVPKSFSTLVQASPEIRELDIDELRLALKDLEDSEEGMPFPDTHRHVTEITVAGITYSRFVEIINGYTITFENGSYGLNLVGANSNIMDVINFNQVSVRSNNSAGLISGVPYAEAIKDLFFTDQDIETNINFLKCMRAILSAQVGKLSGAGPGTLKNLKIRDANDTKDRISATADQYGNRITITLDLD